MADPEIFMSQAHALSRELFLAGKRSPLPPDVRTEYAEKATKLTVEVKSGRETFVIPRPGSITMLLSAQCAILPIMREKDEDGHWIWQMHPDPFHASPGAWCWLWPVRMGWRSYMFQTFYGTPAHSFWQQEIDKWEADSSHAARRECLNGETIIDVAAFSLDFSKCFGRLNEASCVIGHPIDSYCAYGKPARLFRTVRKWLDARCAGAVLIGRDWENDIWLRGCEAGIVTDDIAHGKYIQKLLRRPYEGPQVLVAA